MRIKNKCCATCRYGNYDKMQGYVCVNSESEYAADFVEASHYCIDYESREDEKKHGHVAGI